MKYLARLLAVTLLLPLLQTGASPSPSRRNSKRMSIFDAIPDGQFRSGRTIERARSGRQIQPLTCVSKKGAETAEDRRFERQDSKVEAKPTAPLSHYLSTDANAPKYHIKYRVKNVSELKSLLTKQSNQPTLAWQASLRPNLGNNATFVTTRTIPKRCVSTLDNTGNLVADDTRKRRRRRDEQ